MPVIQRDRNNKKLIEAVNFLKLEFPIKDISVRMGVDKGNLSSFLNNKKSVSSKFLDKFEKEFSVELSGFVYEDKETEILKKQNILNEPREGYGPDYKELYFREKKVVDFQFKIIDELRQELILIKELNTKSKAG
jgi:transcriptional regulator with XRE-family HTH domain